MRIIKFNLILIFFISFNCFSNNYFNDKIVQDSVINFPIEAKISFDFIDLKDVEIKNNFFTSKAYYEISFNKDISKHKYDEWKDFKQYAQLNFTEQPGSLVSDEIIDDNSYIRNFDFTRFDHNWDVRNYPFDQPALNFVFNTTVDTSYVTISANKNNRKNFRTTNLKDGFIVKDVSSKNKYVKRDQVVVQELTFSINLFREGSWLYLKLFLGSILAFIISWLVFFISTEDFSSRVELSVGAIFGAVGNRSYVESIIPDVQVLTIADMINNLIIFLIVFNILIFMIQKNKKITWTFFESNWNASIYSLYVFISLNCLVLLWPILGVYLLIITIPVLYLGTFLPQIISKIYFKK